MVLTLNKCSDHQELGGKFCLSLLPSSWWTQPQPASRGHWGPEHQGSMFLQQLHPLHHLSSPKEFLKRMNKFETEGSLCRCQLPRGYISEPVVSAKDRGAELLHSNLKSFLMHLLCKNLEGRGRVKICFSGTCVHVFPYCRCSQRGLFHGFCLQGAFQHLLSKQWHINSRWIARKDVFSQHLHLKNTAEALPGLN